MRLRGRGAKRGEQGLQRGLPAVGKAVAKQLLKGMAVGNGRAIKQRIQSLHIPPCHRHMVIATILSSLYCLAALQRKPDQLRMLP